MVTAEADAALAAMANATTETEVMDQLWRAHEAGATWQECREAYEKYRESK